MAYCPLLRTYGGRERHTERLLVFHLRLRASILQFPVWALSGATWNCTPAKPHAASPAHLLLFHLSFHFSVSSLPPCLCNVTISMLRTSKASPGHQSLRRPVSCLTVSQSVGWSVPRLALLLNYSFNCSDDGSATYSLSHSSFIFLFSLFCLYSHLPLAARNMHVWGILDVSEADTLSLCNSFHIEVNLASAHFSSHTLKQKVLVWATADVLGQKQPECRWYFSRTTRWKAFISSDSKTLSLCSVHPEKRTVHFTH